MTSEPQTAPAPTGAKGTTQTVELTRAQRTVARRTAESKATIPDFRLAVEADVTDLLAALPADVALDDATVKAAALALRDHPRVNGAYADGAFELHSRVNVGVAVSAPDTLLVPTIFDADAKPVAAIAAERAALTAAVLDGTIASPKLSGATFTVAITTAASLTPIIAPGQAAALAAGAPVERLALDGAGTPTVRRRLTLTLTADHRILYPADAAAFLHRVGELLATPATLLA